MNELARVTDVALAVSLHAPNDPLRNQLVPINRNTQFIFSLTVFEIIWVDSATTGELPLSTMLKGVNDSDELARELSALVKTIRCKINLIPFNPFPGTRYEVSSRNRIYAFQRILLNDGHVVTVRKTRGDDIYAACGQLAGQVVDKTKRSSRYIQTQDVTEHIQEISS